MTSADSPLKARLFKVMRVVFFLATAMVLFYIGINFRVIEIPDYYVELHPLVLPGQHWVIVRGGGVPDAGDLVMFACEDGTAGRHISILIGRPGQTVDFDPDTMVIRVDGIVPAIKCELNETWSRAHTESFTLGPEEALLIDNNPFDDGPRFWKIEVNRLIGRFLFQLPF